MGARSTNTRLNFITIGVIQYQNRHRLIKRIAHFICPNTSNLTLLTVIDIFNNRTIILTRLIRLSVPGILTRRDNMPVLFLIAPSSKF